MYRQSKFKGFVNIELNEKERMHAKALRDDASRLLELLQSLAVAQYEFKVSYDTKQGAYRCIIFGSFTSDDSGKAIGSLAGTAAGAIAVALIKATESMELGKWKEPGRTTAIEL